MARIFIGVGSNQEREQRLRAGMAALRRVFDNVRASAVYENEAVGFEGDNFYNFVVSCDAAMGLDEVLRALRAIEDENGRDRSQPRFSPRKLDLDLLLYDDLVVARDALQLPRPDIEEYAFVLRPLAELAGDLRHPVSGKTYARLWAEFDQSRQPLQRVELDLGLDDP